MSITINGTGRNTPAHVVAIGAGVRLMFSYSTLIAATVGGDFRWRLPNLWGPTTGRHFNEFGTANWPVWPSDPQSFNTATENAIAAYLGRHSRARN
ncbi:MAG: hypothetical protein AB7P02_12705 [Alphaproteobacteria bacterium]